MKTDSSIVRRQKAERVTLIGSALDLFLGVIKIVIGIIGNSTALVVDGVHSLSDLATDFMVIVVMRHSAKAPDQQHPFGHQRFETLGTVAMGLVLIGVAVAVAWQSVLQLLAGGVAVSPTWPVLVAAALSVVGKEWIYRYTVRVGRELKSDLLIANAWHSRSDAFSSIVVFIAVIGAMLGALWLDALAAVIVALMIARIGWDLVIKNISELVDTGLPLAELNKIHAAVIQIAGVEDAHNIRGRTMAGQVLLELHLEVNSTRSASEAHFIGNQVRNMLIRDFDDIREVIFHIDTKNNHADEKSLQLPARSTIEQCLLPLLISLSDNRINNANDYRLTLYYTADKVNLELKISLAVAHLPLQQQLNEALHPYDWFGKLTVWHGDIASKN